MGIWGKLSRKSISSSSSGGESGSVPSTPTSSSASSRSTNKTSHLLVKTLSWRPKSHSKDKHKPDDEPFYHPAERPLTEMNLRHQEMLSGFTFKFGRRKSSAGGRTSFSNVSPCHSRPSSIDGNADQHHYAQHHSAAHMDMARRVSSLARDGPPREAPEE